jgi:hypothetical protein
VWLNSRCACFESSFIRSSDAIRFSAAKSVNNISLLAQTSAYLPNIRENESGHLGNSKAPYSSKEIKIGSYPGYDKNANRNLSTVWRHRMMFGGY